MTRTVHLVVVGGGAAEVHAATAAARRGERVLLVCGPADQADAVRAQRVLRAAGPDVKRRVMVMTGTELVCVDGVGGVEAVVVRHVGSGRLVAFNARAVVRPPPQAPKA